MITKGTEWPRPCFLRDVMSASVGDRDRPEESLITPLITLICWILQKHCEELITPSVGVTIAMRLTSSRSSIALQSRGIALWSRLLCGGQGKLILCESIR